MRINSVRLYYNFPESDKKNWDSTYLRKLSERALEIEEGVEELKSSYPGLRNVNYTLSRFSFRFEIGLIFSREAESDFESAVSTFIDRVGAPNHVAGRNIDLVSKVLDRRGMRLKSNALTRSLVGTGVFPVETSL